MNLKRHFIYGFIALFATLALQACTKEPSAEDHIKNAQILLQEASGQISIIKRVRTQSAVAELKAALKKDRDNQQANTLLGTTYFSSGDYDEADSKLSRALALGADPSAIVPMLAQVLVSIGEFERLDSLSLAGLDPEGRSTLQAAKALSMVYRDRPELADELMDAARQSETLSPFAEVAAARLAVAKGDYAEARAQLKMTLERFPRYAPAWYLLGNVEIALGNPDEALAAYQTVLSVAGRRVDAGLNSVLMYLYTGNTRRAAVELDKLDKSFPSVIAHDDRRFLKALLQLHNNPPRGARQTFMKIDAIEDYPQTFYYLAAIDLEEGLPELALSHVYQFLRFVPGSLAGTRLAAKLELGRGEYGKADYMLRRLLKRYPDDIESLDLLARAKIGLGKSEEGIRLLARVVELEPESNDARLRLAAAYLELESEELHIDALPEVLLEVVRTESLASKAVQAVSDTGGEVESGEPALSVPEKRPEDTQLLSHSRREALVIPAGDEVLVKGAELPADSLEKQKRPTAAGQVESEALGYLLLQNILSEDPGYQPADVLIVLDHLRGRRFSDAVRAAQDYLERSPSSATAYGLLGRAYLANGENEKAQSSFQKALELQPGEPDAASGLAEFALIEKDYDSARDYYRQILRHNPNHVESSINIAATFAEEGRDEEMLEILQRTSIANPRAIEPHLARIRYFLAKGQLDEATYAISGLTDEQKQHPDAMATIAAWELVKERYDQALITLRQLIRERPNVGQYHYLRAKAYAALGDRKRMVAELERTMRLEPDHFYGKVAATRLALAAGEYGEFEQKLRELTAVAPDNLDVLKLQAVSAQMRGDLEMAGRSLERVQRQDPSSGNVVALAEHKVMSQEIKGAVELLQAWIAEHPDDVLAREKLAEILAVNGRIGEAILQYERILKLAPDHVAALNNLAWHLLDDDPDDALEYAEKAAYFRPNSSAVLDTLAMAQLKSGKLGEARRSIDRARVQSPSNPTLQFHEAQIAAAEGDTTGAKKTLESLLRSGQVFPQSVEAENYLKGLD